MALVDKIDGGEELEFVGDVGGHFPLVPDVNTAKFNEVPIVGHQLLPELRKIYAISVGGIEDLNHPQGRALFHQVMEVVGCERSRC